MEYKYWFIGRVFKEKILRVIELGKKEKYS